MADRDPYRIIGIPPISNDSDIKKAYRAKSKMYHPDLNPDLKIWADEKMKELVEAYNLISDPEKKKAYDLSYNLQYRRDRKKKQKKKAVQKTFWDKVMDFINGTNVPKKPKQSSKPTKQLKGKKREIEYDPKEAETHFGLVISMCDTLSFLDHAIDSFK